MSDWRSRATKVEPQGLEGSAEGGWRARASPAQKAPSPLEGIPRDDKPQSPYGSPEAVAEFFRGGQRDSLDAKVRSALDNFTLGHGDEVVQKIDSLLGTTPPPGEYDPEAYSRAARDNPGTGFVGRMAASYANPVGRLVPGAGFLPIVGRQALEGAAEGVVEAHGKSDGQATPEEYLDAALLEGGVGAAGGVVGGALGAMGGWLGRRFAKTADGWQLRAAGVSGEGLEQLERNVTPPRPPGGPPNALDVDEVAKRAADEVRSRGTVRPDATPDSIAREAAATRKAHGEAVDATVKEVDARARAAGVRPDFRSAALALEQKAQQLADNPAPEVQAVARRLMQHADGMAQKAATGGTFHDLWRWRVDFDQEIQKLLGADPSALRKTAQAQREVREMMEGLVEDGAKKVGLADAYAKVKNDYGTSAVLSGEARDARQAALRGRVEGGPGEALRAARNVLAGGMGALPAARRAAAGGEELLREAGASPRVASWLDSASSFMGRNGERARALGMGAGALADYTARAATDSPVKPRPTATQQVQYLLTVNPEAVPAAHREGLARALEKGEKNLATYLWAKASGGDAEFQRFYNGLLSNSLGVEASQ